jgi:hypothetical protein
MQLKPLRKQEAYAGVERGTISISRCRMVGLLRFGVSDEVKVGRLRDAIREAGLTVQEFLKLLK